MAAETTQYGRWVIYHAETGEREERWPIDARPMLDCGEYVETPPDGVAKPVELPEPRGLSASVPGLPDGYWVQFKEKGTWYTLMGPEGKVGVAKHTREEAVAQLPVHPSGGPLKVGEAGPAKPVELPAPRTGRK